MPLITERREGSKPANFSQGACVWSDVIRKKYKQRSHAGQSQDPAGGGQESEHHQRRRHLLRPRFVPFRKYICAPPAKEDDLRIQEIRATKWSSGASRGIISLGVEGLVTGLVIMSVSIAPICHV